MTSTLLSYRLRRVAFATTCAIAISLLATTPFVAHASYMQATAVEAHRTALRAQETEALNIRNALAHEIATRDAKAALTHASDVLAAVSMKVDTANLSTSANALGGFASLSTHRLTALTGRTEAAAHDATVAAAAVDQIAAAAATAETARVAEQAAADAEALHVVNTPAGARATAQAMASSNYGWGSGEFSCLNNLWQKESGWSYTANNASGGAHGIPQSLPGNKMASAGADWQTNAATQISWGLDYIKRSYGSPCGAWAHSVAVNWY